MGFDAGPKQATPGGDGIKMRNQVSSDTSQPPICSARGADISIHQSRINTSAGSIPFTEQPSDDLSGCCQRHAVNKFDLSRVFMS
jgi:hypothetical protein